MAQSAQSLLERVQTTITRVLGTQHRILNLAIRFFANYLLFALYPKYLVLVYLGTNGLFSYDLFTAGEAGIHASLWFSLLVAVLFVFYVLLPAFLWRWWRMAVKEYEVGRSTMDAVDLKAKGTEAWQAALLFFLVSAACLFVVVYSFSFFVWKFLVFILFFVGLFIGATVLALKWDTLRYMAIVSVIYGILLVLPLIATMQTSIFVGLGLQRFGLGGLNDVTVYLDRDRADARAVTGTLILLSPDNIYLSEASTARLLIIRRSESGFIAYPAEAKPNQSEKRAEPVGPTEAQNEEGRIFDWRDLWSPVDFFYAMLGTLLGAVLGVGLTVLFERISEKRRCRRSLQAIRRSMGFCLERTEQAKDLLQKGGAPSFPLDASRLADWLSAADGVLSEQLWRDLDWHRFQLEHITHKLVVYNAEFVRRQTVVPIPLPSPYEDALRVSLIGHCDIVIKGTPPLLAKLAASIA